MEKHPLLAILAAGFVLAFVLGLVAQRLRVSPLVGYLLAGVAIGPHTPGYIADQRLAYELAEVGVILLMFGVGLHFSVRDLLAVRRIAVTGAVLQIGTATLLGLGLALALGWAPGTGLIFGLALSVASTVVLLRALEERGMVESTRGRIAVGWLVVEDLVMVLALVLIPATMEALAPRADGTGGGAAAIAATIALTVGKVVAFAAIALVLAGFGLGLWGIISGRVTALPAFIAICIGTFLVLFSSFYAFARHTVLTPEGAREHEYLMGVKEFIRVAEADRLQMLQSYSGAERRQDGTANVIVVYERLLPYAMLFGMEDEWGSVLENVYAFEQRGATWIGDPSAPFLRAQLAAFAVSSHAAASYSAPSASSSSSGGGSFGGGFSGGGGGGGFSGGR